MFTTEGTPSSPCELDDCENRLPSPSPHGKVKRKAVDCAGFAILLGYPPITIIMLDLPPTQDSSHHQDYEKSTFLGSGIPLNLYLPLLLGGG